MDDRLVLVGATVIDGTGAPPEAGCAIVVAGDRIADVVPAARVPAGAVLRLDGLSLPTWPHQLPRPPLPWGRGRSRASPPQRPAGPHRAQPSHFAGCFRLTRYVLECLPLNLALYDLEPS